MREDLCAICERMKQASRLPVRQFKPLCYGGRRPGAGRKPSTLKGILKKLPKEIAENLERELRAKAELFLAEIKLEMLRKRNIGDESSEPFISGNSDNMFMKPGHNEAI